METTEKPLILVTSAAGKTGMRTALQLLDKGYPVRAFVRRADERSRLLERAGADVHVGDQFSVPEMRLAMAGVERAYCCPPAAPNGLHFVAVFAAAAREARLGHVVFLGQWLSQDNHPSVFTREVWLAEQILGTLPETTLTIVNVGWFADNYFLAIEGAAQLGLLTMPLGDGDRKTNAPPSLDDIAAVVVGALSDPDAHAGKTYRPTGPDLLSPNEIAAVLGKVLNRRIRYRDVSEAIFLKALTANKPLNYSPSMLTQLNLYTKEYSRGTFAVGAPTDAVVTVGGRPPESFEATARRAVAERPEARPSMGGKLRALWHLLKTVVTPAPDPDRIEARRNHVILGSPEFSHDNVGWRRTHRA